MATIEQIQVPGGGLVGIKVQTLEHCPPHATCIDRAGQWSVKIEFSYIHNRTTLLSVIPPQNRPQQHVLDSLKIAMEKNLPAYREKWWENQKNNPHIHATGACCLNNQPLNGKRISSAIYDVHGCKTIVALDDGSTYHWP